LRGIAKQNQTKIMTLSGAFGFALANYMKLLIRYNSTVIG
jgi:hypothetical protein